MFKSLLLRLKTASRIMQPSLQTQIKIRTLDIHCNRKATLCRAVRPVPKMYSSYYNYLFAYAL